MPVRVDDESVHSRVYQVIEGKRHERFLKNRDKRFRHFVGQWTQPRAKSRSQNECLCNVIHEQKIERFFNFARNDKTDCWSVRYRRYSVRVPKSMMPW